VSEIINTHHIVSAEHLNRQADSVMFLSTQVKRSSPGTDSLRYMYALSAC